MPYANVELVCSDRDDHKDDTKISDLEFGMLAAGYTSVVKLAQTGAKINWIKLPPPRSWTMPATCQDCGWFALLSHVLST
jgi:hypothetical protein